MKKLWDSYSYAIILVVLSFGLSVFFALKTEVPNQDEFVKVVVREGDSIWKMAGYFGDEHDLSAEEFVKWVENNNGVSYGKIYPGEELIIPVKETRPHETNLASSYFE
ncbi:cell division suppressor protein YneA [Cytobacillus purgationiresistens]|uniref:LysM domain-containing protein n=1 Tax=Cytobacillus purgationiresistens TaxID=863449 RepID=A0ABU0APR2_9BACI|nr:LysM peptidoglycan-binding domain-containing protein [Cytobacillus purgationiresistens]MDQ0273281.1 hypothetical protein [Cytobacillus purgationiresistens]